jgi:restriction endonuclease Mrr
MTDAHEAAARFRELASYPNNLDQILGAINGTALEQIFELYSEKLEELKILERSQQNTIRASQALNGIFSDLQANIHNNPPPQKLELVNLEREIIRLLQEQPEQIHQIKPRQFEEIVCALLVDMGLDVHLTPQTRDGGRDILAVSRTPFGELLMLVECKRYNPENPISVDQIRSFLYTVRDGDRASCGLLATTSYFSKDAANLAANYAYQMKLRDFEGVKEWIARYGAWSQVERGGFWFPSTVS